MSDPLHHADALTRRHAMRLAAATLFGVSMPGWLGAAEPLIRHRPTAKHCIWLTMSGGMSHLDTFDCKPGRPVQGPTKVQQVGEAHINAVLARTAGVLRHATVIRGLTSNQGAHEQASYLMHTGFQQRGTIRHPQVGAWAVHAGGRINPTLPGAVGIGTSAALPGAGFLPTSCAPLVLGRASDGLRHAARPSGVDEHRERRRLALLDDLTQRWSAGIGESDASAWQRTYADALALMRSTDLKAFDLSSEPEVVRRAYGDSPFGQGCLLARRLVERGVRWVEVDLGGWDTHVDNFERVDDLCAVLDTGYAALIDDLYQRGILADTMVVLASEFGRSPDIADGQGRNHHPAAFCALLAGGGIAGGRVHGRSDADGRQVVDGRMGVTDLLATVAYGLGLPLDQTFHSPEGRPFTIADKGRPVLDLFV